MNTSQETEPLQNALAGLATVMTKMVTERSEQALAESFPAMHPVGDASGRLLKKTQSAELLMSRFVLWTTGWDSGFRPITKSVATDCLIVVKFCGARCE